jgi:hypothetical protein
VVPPPGDLDVGARRKLIRRRHLDPDGGSGRTFGGFNDFNIFVIDVLELTVRRG